jgi:3-hydroxyacyl-CoA dehydrogenase
MDIKTFTIVGTSVVDGKVTNRFANGDIETRIKALKAAGHTRVSLTELPRPMSKDDALKFLEKKMEREAASRRQKREENKAAKAAQA